MSDQTADRDSAPEQEPVVAPTARNAPGVPVHDPVTENAAERRRREAQQVAQAVQEAEALAARDAATRDAIERQSQLQQVADTDGDGEPDTVGEGGVSLRYLGTSDYFIVGYDEQGREVRAYAGGDPVNVPQELADRITAFPHDTFEEVK